MPILQIAVSLNGPGASGVGEHWPNPPNSRFSTHAKIGALWGPFFCTLVRMERNMKAWVRVRGAEPVPLFPSRLKRGITRLPIFSMMRGYCLPAGIPWRKRIYTSGRIPVGPAMPNSSLICSTLRSCWAMRISSRIGPLDRTSIPLFREAQKERFASAALRYGGVRRVEQAFITGNSEYSPTFR